MVGKNAVKTNDQLPVGIIGCDISATDLIGETSAMPETKGRRLAIAINSIFIVLFSFYCCEHNHPTLKGSPGVIASERKRRVGCAVLCVSMAHIVYISGNGETQFSKKLARGE